MKSSLQFEIKEPCAQDWNHMTPKRDGRFCDSCQLTVVDFANKTPEEISIYLKEYSSESVCGHFKSDDIKHQNKIDSLISSLNKKGLRYISMLILGVLILSGCRSRKSTTSYTNGRVLSDRNTNQKTEQTQNEFKSSTRT
jgi:hypothetical protein